MSKLEVDAIEPQSGTTITIGAAGDTVNLVGTLQSNGSALPGDISSVVAGTGLSGGGTTGAVTINIDSAQPTITSLGTITSFRSTGIDDNATSTAITIDSSENVALAGDITTGNNGSLFLLDNAGQKSGQITTDNSTSNSLQIDADPDNSASGSYTAFRIDNSEKMRLDATGLALKTSAPAVTLDVRATSFTPYNTNTSLIVEAPAVFSQSQHFYIYNAGAYNSSRPTGGIGAVNTSSLISLSAGSICTANPGADGFKATATSSSLYDIGSGEHQFKTKTGLTVGDQFTHQTRMTIKDNGRVGIGTTAPQNKLDITAATWDDGLTIKTTGNTNVGIIADANRSSAGGGLLNLQGRWNGTEVTSILFQAGSDTTNKDDGEIVFRTASAGTPTERMRISSSGNVLVGKTATDVSTVGVEALASGKLNATRLNGNPLDLNRTGSDGGIAWFRKAGTIVGAIGVTASGASISLGGNAAAKTLDDYEEGTWIPSFVNGAGLDSISLVSQAGTYTKVGRLVNFSLKIEIGSASANGNRLEMSGLPFTTGNNSSAGGANWSYVDSRIVNSTSTNVPVLWLPGNNTKIVFYNTAGTDFTGNNLSSTSNATFYINGSYQAN